jgi:hypothetical protein
MTKLYIATDGSEPTAEAIRGCRVHVSESADEAYGDALDITRRGVKAVVWELTLKPVYRVRFEMKSEPIAEGEKP